MMYLLPAVASTHRKPLLNVVHNCDALTLLRGLSSKSVNLILTSPPYDDMRTYGGNWSFPFEAIANESYRVLDDGGVLVWVVGDATRDGCESLTSMRQALYFVDTVGFKMNDTMIYHRQGRFPEVYRYWQDFEYMFVLTKDTPKTFNPVQEPAKYGGKKVSTERQQDGTLKYPKTIRQTDDMKALSNIWYISRGDMARDDSLRYEHPAAFPELLAHRHIMTWTNPGDVVLDFFAGSGTTLKMARNLNRPYIGCDINADYVALAKRRLAQPYTLSMFDRIEPVAKPEQMAFSL